MTTIRATLIASAAALGMGFACPASSADLSDYRIEQLLEPCLLGDNDSREGQQAQQDCNQYIAGFTDAFVSYTDNGKNEGVCLPPRDGRTDKLRRAFMLWAYRNYGERHQPAATGLLATFKTAFACKQ